MTIPINKNIDEYKDDFFKGLTMRQCIYSVLTLAAGTGAYFFTSSILGLPQMLAVYLTMAAALPPAGIGFARIKGMPVMEYFRKKRETARHAVLFYAMDETEFLPEPEKKRVPLSFSKKFLELVKRKTGTRLLLEETKSIRPEEAERWLYD